MNILTVENISKSYPGFELRDISFAVEKGSVMGFIGRNGAGKTTALKSVMNLVHPDSGRALFYDSDIKENERAVKQRIGYAGGAVDYYKKKPIRSLLKITKSFYPDWDDAICEKYMKLFALDENKTPAELSEGMKVKLSLTSALSHGAELLILDEPTSGLDPVSRSELLEIFSYLRSQGVSILFSTHITSDLDKIADKVTYIRDGRIIFTGDIEHFRGGETLEEVMIRLEMEAFHEKLDL